MNTLVVDNSASASLDYFQSSFAPPNYDARCTDTGNLRVKLEMDKPANCPLSIFCFLEMQSAIKIHKNGKIVVDTV